MTVNFIVIAITSYSDATARVELAPDESDALSLTNFWGGKAIGRIEMTITKPETISFFKVGDIYQIGLIDVGPPPPNQTP